MEYCNTGSEGLGGGILISRGRHTNVLYGSKEVDQIAGTYVSTSISEDVFQPISLPKRNIVTMN